MSSQITKSHARCATAPLHACTVRPCAHRSSRTLGRSPSGRVETGARRDQARISTGGAVDLRQSPQPAGAWRARHAACAVGGQAATEGVSRAARQDACCAAKHRPRQRTKAREHNWDLAGKQSQGGVSVQEEHLSTSVALCGCAVTAGSAPRLSLASGYTTST